jgi:hypothetical protein
VIRLENTEQHSLALALLEEIDRRGPTKTQDVLLVLTQMLIQCVIVHAFDRAGAENTMDVIKRLMDQTLREAEFKTPPAEDIPPSARH